MKKKTYLKPAMRVVLIQQHEQLLTGSVGASRSDYGLANYGVDSNELDDETGEWEWN